MARGEKLRDFFSSETESLLAIYRNIENLIPHPDKKGSQHVAEEGRYLESILRTLLNKYLPQGLKAVSGFILRPATKVRDGDRRRLRSDDQYSSQLDIIVYDFANFPCYEKFEEFVIVPPEGVISVISCKKNLYENEIEKEITALSKTVKLCKYKNNDNLFVRSPNIALVSFSNEIERASDIRVLNYIFAKIKEVHRNVPFDQCINQIIVLDKFTIFKRKP
ncbi:MAG: hypothetical protein GY771_13890, partial [bacterium]|nr:hypothetical protein [bacterium]